MEIPEYEKYGLSEEDWNALTPEDQESYRAIGDEENQSSEEPNEEATEINTEEE